MNVSEENLLKSISNDALLDLTQRYGQSPGRFPLTPATDFSPETTKSNESGGSTQATTRTASTRWNPGRGGHHLGTTSRGPLARSPKSNARLNDALDGLRSPLLLAKNYILMQAQALEDEAAGGVSEPGTDHNLTHPHRLAPFGQAAVYPFSGSALATCP
uniref:Uncharacterized protein n=1 Tax=Labrus bergylta TaxID=56723 RepID=A0A3Q3F8S7_9LABR